MTSKKELSRQKRHRKIRTQVVGTTEKPRLVVSRSLANVSAQLIDDSLSKTLASASTLKTKGVATLASAVKVGEEIAKLAKTKKIKTCVFDRNGYKFHGKVKAVAEGARAEGLKF